MNLPGLISPMNSMLMELQVNEILEANANTMKYGLVLTEKEAIDIVESRNQLLKGYGRVELDMEATKKLIYKFSAVDYINQEDYAAALKDLQEIFYYLKNETNDEIGDDRLLVIIEELLDSSCEGSVELLQGIGIEEFLRDYRLKRCSPDSL